MSDTNKNLYYLHELSDYKVASDYCDVRGWEVKDSSNKTVGKIDNLLVNKKAERVVYLDVELDPSIIEEGHKALDKSSGDGIHEFINKDGENHLIIPIGMASLDEENELVICNEIDSNTFSKAGRFSKDADISPEFEILILNHYTRGERNDRSTDKNKEFYNRKEFDNSLAPKNKV